jgi:small subunit ribosomal protein S13
MITLLGHNLILTKKIYIALTSIYGIGFSSSLKILTELNINPHIKVANLTQNELFLLQNFFNNNNTFKIEGTLKQFNVLNIKNLISINCFRGKRHFKGLPLHGQRTRTNSRTVRKLHSLK